MTGKKILVCPLNWGLGHAGRCVPLIEELIEAGNEVTIGADGKARAFLKDRFPQLPTIEFPDYGIRIPRKGRLTSYLLLRLPLLFAKVRCEHKRLESLIALHHFEVVISDNRYGLHTQKAFTIFITHQLMVKLPPVLRFAEILAHRIILRYVKKFNRCLIPDVEGMVNLSGDLSHKYPLPSNACFAGLMSRFSRQEARPELMVPSYDVVCILSGPEPQRSHAERLLMEILQHSNQQCCMLRGIPGNTAVRKMGKIDVYDHATDECLRQLITQCRKLICRPGYTSLMDLVILRKSALLIPTPGQSEQIYLASIMKQRGWFDTVRQEELSPEIFNQYLEKTSIVIPVQEMKNFSLLCADDLKEHTFH